MIKWSACSCLFDKYIQRHKHTSSTKAGRKNPPIRSVNLHFPTQNPRSWKSLSGSSSSNMASAKAVGVGSKFSSSGAMDILAGGWLPLSCASVTLECLAISCSSDTSSKPIFSLTSVSLSWEAESSAGARNTQSRLLLLQLTHGCDLSHLSLRRRHSKQDVIMRFRRRILVGADVGREESAMVLPARNAPKDATKL